VWKDSRVSFGDQVEDCNITSYEMIQHEELEISLNKLGVKGDVYLGVWRFTEVAVKEVTGRNDEASLCLEAEVFKLKALHHPNVIGIFGCIAGPKRFIVMEYLSHGSLYDLLYDRQAEISWYTRMRIALDVTRGLIYLHLENILHSNLRSTNVLLSDSGQARLSDFGLTKFRTAGDVRWMAPELFSEPEIYTRKSDVYSLGVTLWELVSRKIPFQNASNSELICTWVKDGQREDVPEDCPPTLAHVIKTCWSGDPGHRPHAEAVLEHLKSLVDTELPVVRSGRNSRDAALTEISLSSTGTASGVSVTTSTCFPLTRPLERWTDAELKTRLEVIQIEMNRGARAGPPSYTRSLEQWSCEEVVDWLISVQLSSLIPVVRERAIGGEMLGCCETEEAVAELGFGIDQARLLFRKVQECKASARMPLSPLFATIASGSASSVDSILEPVAQGKLHCPVLCRIGYKVAAPLLSIESLRSLPLPYHNVCVTV